MNEPKVNINVMPGAQMNGYVKEQHNYFGTVHQISSSASTDNSTETANATSDPASSPVATEGQKYGDEELFHFVHPSVGEDEEWQIHNEVKRLVRRFGIQEICKYLMLLKAENKILLPQSVGVAYQELVRMGMPSGEGFAEKTFTKYYNRV